MKTVKLLVLSMVLALTACGGKKDDNKNKPAGSGTAQTDKDKPAPGSDKQPAGSGSETKPAAGSGSETKPAAGSGSGDTTAQAGSGSGAGSGSAAPAADPNADYIEVLASHAEKKPEDPVTVKFEKFTVAKAAFDPKKIEGGTATIEVDLTSLKSGSDKRDGHLATKDYFDSSTPAFAKLTIDIADVKKKGDDKHFTANANVKLHGVEKKLPVEFEVVDAKDDWIRVKGEAKVKRNDFKVGKAGKDEPVADDLTFRLQLTLKKT
jgi:polyisoprenoid-binding protein YceI